MITQSICCVIFIGYICCVHASSKPQQDYYGVEKKLLDSLEFIHGEDFKSRITIDRGVEQCFYQPTSRGSVLYVHYHVHRGGDRTISLYVFKPSGHVLLGEENKFRLTHRFEVGEDHGYYKICFDNSQSTYSMKVVDIHIATWSDDDWEEYQESFEQFEDSAQLSSKSLLDLRMKIRHMRADWGRYRSTMYRDEIIVQNLGNLVHKISFSLCALILMTSGFQVFFLRRLFMGCNVKGRA